MSTNQTPRRAFRRTYRMAATAACATALWAAPASAHAATTHSTDDFDFDADGLCPFTVHVTVHLEADTTTQTTAGGSVETDRTIETDTVTANGVTVEGLPYHDTVRRTFDSDGNQTSAIAQGEEWRFRLPGGSVWSAGGRNDFLNGRMVGSWSFEDGLGPVCDALAG